MGYTSLLVRGLIRLFVPHGYTTLLFQGGVYLMHPITPQIFMVYNPVISGWCIPHSLRSPSVPEVYNPVISGWCIPPPHIPELSLTGIQPCYFRVVYTPHRHIQFPESAGRHLSHNKPANRVFLLPRRPCISTGVNSGYTVRTRFISLAMCAIIAHFIYLV